MTSLRPNLLLQVVTQLLSPNLEAAEEACQEDMEKFKQMQEQLEANQRLMAEQEKSWE